jgi:hypothetical protein
VLIAGMKKTLSSLFFVWLLSFTGNFGWAQEVKVPKLVWKVNRIDLGTVLEEQGLQTVEFEFTYNQDSIFYIQEIIPECGCTSFDYTSDTLKMGETGKVKLSFDPSSAAGFFSKLIVVRGLGGVQDSLFLDGTAIPYPSNLSQAYPVKIGNLGFRMRKVNMGDVFDNEPKIKYVEFFNFGDDLLEKSKLSVDGPPFIQMEQVQEFVRPNERGLLKLIYDSRPRKDLGFFEDQLTVSWQGINASGITFDVLADLFEYFPPIPKNQLNEVAQLYIQQKEVDLREISSKSLVRRTVTISNRGKKQLEIRKIQGNCECLTIEAPKTILEPGESMDLRLVFDPIGRKGIDQRNIYIFSNDPLNPVQLIVLKSRIE